MIICCMENEDRLIWMYHRLIVYVMNTGPWNDRESMCKHSHDDLLYTSTYKNVQKMQQAMGSFYCLHTFLFMYFP